jgi:hypothetical protein
MVLHKRLNNNAGERHKSIQLAAMLLQTGQVHVFNVRQTCMDSYTLVHTTAVLTGGVHALS